MQWEPRGTLELAARGRTYHSSRHDTMLGLRKLRESTRTLRHAREWSLRRSCLPTCSRADKTVTSPPLRTILRIGSGEDHPPEKLR